MVLGQHLPPAAVEPVANLFTANPLSIGVVRQRTSKSGDYRPAHRGRPARITINGSLNPYAFLITLIHEIAHHHVQLDYDRAAKKFTLRRKRPPAPHGKEWKTKFTEMMIPFLTKAAFPEDLLPVLAEAMINPKASSSAEHHLSKILKRYDPPDNTVRLEDLPFGALFSLHGRRVFVKKEKMRTRYRCVCMSTNRLYLVSANAPVEIIIQ